MPIALNHKKVHADIVTLSTTNLQNCTRLWPPPVHVMLNQKWATENILHTSDGRDSLQDDFQEKCQISLKLSLGGAK